MARPDALNASQLYSDHYLCPPVGLLEANLLCTAVMDLSVTKLLCATVYARLAPGSAGVPLSAFPVVTVKAVWTTTIAKTAIARPR